MSDYINETILLETITYILYILEKSYLQLPMNIIKNFTIIFKTFNYNIDECVLFVLYFEIILKKIHLIEDLYYAPSLLEIIPYIICKYVDAMLYDDSIDGKICKIFNINDKYFRILNKYFTNNQILLTETIFKSFEIYKFHINIEYQKLEKAAYLKNYLKLNKLDNLIFI